MGNEVYKDGAQLTTDARARIQVFLSISRYFIRGNVADFGAGDGFISNNLRNWGLAVDNFDYYPRNNYKYIDLSDVTWHSESKYNTIFMTHVIEHFHEPNIALNIMYDSLTTDGYGIIAVPNGVYNDDYRAKDETIGHYTAFTKETLKTLLEITFDVILLGELNHSATHHELIAIVRKK